FCSFGFLTFLFLSLVLDARTTKSQGNQLTLNGIVGGSVVFSFKVPPWVPVETIVWNSVTTLATVTPRKGKPATVKVLDKRYIGRLRVLDRTYSLVISNLSILDQGIYRAQINTEFTTTVTEYNCRWLQIPPTSTVTWRSCPCCTMTLSCTVNTGDNVTYSWASSQGNAFQMSLYNGSLLHLSLTPEESSFSCVCNASNRVSWQTTSFSSSVECIKEPGGKRCWGEGGGGGKSPPTAPVDRKLVRSMGSVGRNQWLDVWLATGNKWSAPGVGPGASSIQHLHQ
uniref:Ig-like domain-containing protein n=1 Tax=Pelusios castaneus TaxID=367368 RepID=A0A8C8RPY7_9SAUR